MRETTPLLFDVISFDVIHYITAICRNIVIIGTEMQLYY